MQRSPRASHPDERLLEAVRCLGDWLEEGDRRPAPERLALVLDAPVRRALLSSLPTVRIDRAAA